MPTADISHTPSKTASDNGFSHLYLLAASGGRPGSGFGGNACRKALAASGRRKPVGLFMLQLKTKRLRRRGEDGVHYAKRSGVSQSGMFQITEGPLQGVISGNANYPIVPGLVECSSLRGLFPSDLITGLRKPWSRPRCPDDPRRRRGRGHLVRLHRSGAGGPGRACVRPHRT